MKLCVILLALNVLSAACIACTSAIASQELNGSSEVNRTERSLHKRLHIDGQKDFLTVGPYKSNVKIVWKISDLMRKIPSDDIGIKNGRGDWTHYKCSGAVIKPAWVVTAACCFEAKILQLGKKWKEALTFTLYPYGQVYSELQTQEIQDVHIHNLYVKNSRRNNPDVALVKLKNEFFVNPLLFPPAFPLSRLGKNLAYSEYRSRNNMRNCFVTGFGEDVRTAEVPFSMKLSMYDVRAAGPKYCEILQRAVLDREGTSLNIPVNYKPQAYDIFDSWFICTKYHKWFLTGKRLPENEVGLGCFGEVGSMLTCDDHDVIVGIQSKTFLAQECGDDDGYTTFTSLGDRTVYSWIQGHIPDIGPLVPLQSKDFAYKYRGSGITTSSTSSVSTGGVIILGLATTTTAFTFY